MLSPCVCSRRRRSGGGFFNPVRTAKAWTGCFCRQSSIAAAALATWLLSHSMVFRVSRQAFASGSHWSCSQRARALGWTRPRSAPALRRGSRSPARPASHPKPPARKRPEDHSGRHAPGSCPPRPEDPLLPKSRARRTENQQLTTLIRRPKRVLSR
jgi:hypothetical protein